MPCGCITVSVSASATFKTSWPSVESQSATRRSGNGVSSLGAPTLDPCVAAREGQDTWFLDEVFVSINGERRYLWRAVDQDGDVLDILVRKRRNKRAAKRFFIKLLKGLRYVPRVIVTDKLGSYGAARREVPPSVRHVQDRWCNNRAEVSHQPTRQRERQMPMVQVDATRTVFLIEPWSDQQSVPTLSARTESGTLSHPSRQGV